MAYYVIQVTVYLVGGQLHYFSRSGILQFDWLISPKFTLGKFSIILSTDSHVLQWYIVVQIYICKVYHILYHVVVHCGTNTHL